MSNELDLAEDPGAALSGLTHAVADALRPSRSSRPQASAFPRVVTAESPSGRSSSARCGTGAGTLAGCSLARGHQARHKERKTSRSSRSWSAKSLLRSTLSDSRPSSNTRERGSSRRVESNAGGYAESSTMGWDRRSPESRSRSMRRATAPAETSTSSSAEPVTETNAAVADVRRIVRDLRAPALDDLGLVEALFAYAQSLSPMRVEFDVDPDLNGLPAAVETALYRITCESLTNAVRHAHASHCHAGLHTEESHVALEVEDDGAGLFPSPSPVSASVRCANARRSSVARSPSAPAEAAAS